MHIKKIIELELALLNNDASKLFIGGFSQGCAMSLHTAYTMKDIKFGGVIAVAGYMFEITPYSEEREKEIPFLIVHGA